MVSLGDNADALAARATICKRIKDRRAELGLGLAELGRLIDTDRQVIAHWERGTQKPREDKMLTLAKALKTSISFLYGETDDPRTAPEWNSSVGPTSEWEARLEQAKQKLAEIAELLTPSEIISPERAELLRIASTSARGSTLYPEAVAKPVKSTKAKAQGE